MNNKTKKISHISALHIVKLVVRFLIFCAVLVIYITNRAWNSNEYILGNKTVDFIALGSIFVLFMIEMILRFFPSNMESMGCQKQFAKNFCSTNEALPKKQKWQRTFLVVLSWIILNGIIGALYFNKIISKGVLVLISLAYSVCDMVCILFFCPFQTWIMKNKCCTACRIYNWDFAMMFTPLVFIANFFTLGLLIVSLILLLQWELVYRKHPERFYENTNRSITCANCSEKLCHHKKQLQKLIKSIAKENKE